MHRQFGLVARVTVAILAFVACNANAQPFLPQEKPIRINWLTDLDAARAQGRKENKPVLVHFTAGWCPACKQMEQSTYRDSGIANQLANWVAVKVDVDQHKDLVAKYQVKAIPTLWIFKPGGGGYALPAGGKSAKELSEVLKTVK